MENEYLERCILPNLIDNYSEIFFAYKWFDEECAMPYTHILK